MIAPRCIDCRHFAHPRMPSFDPSAPTCWCNRPIGTATDAVNGERVVLLSANPFAQRKREGFFDRLLGIRRCGPEGRFFERASDTPPSGGGGGQ
jgi:hypothetical protein